MKKCDEKWCNGKTDASYKHKSLLYGRYLCGEELKKDLNWAFEKHAKNADALSPNGSACVNEGTQNASLLKSLDFRIAFSVCQKNISRTYMTDVNTAIGLSPRKISHKFSSQ